MRSVFGIGLLLICMTLILDYSSSVLIRGNEVTHSGFCQKYQNLDEQERRRQMFIELDDTGLGVRLCPVIGKEVYGNDAECEYCRHISMSVASSTPGQYPFPIHGQVCECKNRDGIQLPQFGIKRLLEKTKNEVYVLHLQGPPTQLEIRVDTVLYAFGVHCPETKCKTSNWFMSAP